MLIVMDDVVIPDFSRPPPTVEIVVPVAPTPVYVPPAPTPVIYAPPPLMQQPVQPPGNLPLPAPNNPVSIPGPPSQSTNLAPDLSTYPSTNDPYFQLSSDAAPQEDISGWYLYPAANGSVLFNNTIPVPIPSVNQGELHALGGSIFYNANSLMPSTWYLNPSLNGEVILNDASGTQLLRSIDGDLYYNNEILALAGQIENVADWSLYPALQQVELAGQNIIQVGDIDASGAITAGSLALTGNIDISGNITAGALTVTGGIDTGISGIITGGIATNGVGPITSNSVATSQILFDICGGTLTSPDGTVLTFNGQAITTGTEGDAANWANYPAINTVTGLSTAPLALQAGAGQQLTFSAPDNAIAATTGGAYNVTVDKGTNILAAANVNVTAQNGSGGNIALNAQPGYQLGTQQVGFGAIQLNAFGSSNQALGLGGKIDINAYSGGLGEYGSATSRVSISSATIALSAGAVPALPGTPGSMNIFGQDIVSIVASLIPPVLPQFPNSVFIYGDGVPGIAGGVRLSSPSGVQIAGNSDLYATDVYPFTSLGLNLKGRASVPGPAADVTIADCATFAMRNAGTMTGIQSITMAGTGAIENVLTIKPPLASGVGTPNLVISGNPLPLLGFSNYVNIQNAGTIAFDVSGAGALTGVQTVNGVAYPPPLPPIGDVADWATFPAKQNVDMSSNAINNVSAINTIAGATIVSAGALSIFSDASGDLSLAANGGGNVNIGTGNAGDINIQTVGAGNNLNLAGDTTTVTAAVQLTLDTPIIDVVGADIQNVANITNEASNLLTVQSTANLTVSAETALTLFSDSADVTVQGQTGIAIYAATGNVTLTADSGEVVVQDSVLNMNSHKITNVTNGTAAADAVNYGQLTFRDSTEFYVSSQGSDLSGNGSITAPFLTIQKAITTAEVISSAALICNINVASGHYTENLTFNKGYVVLNGSLQSQLSNEICEINGSITINCTGANDTFSRQCAFQGFNITMTAVQSITNTSASNHTVSFQDCKIFVNSVCYNSTATCADARTYFTNCEISQTNAAFTGTVFTTNVGLVELERVDLALDGNATGIVIGGTSVLSRLSLGTMESSNTGATLAPLLSITSSTLSAHSLALASFVFTSATAKTNTNAMQIASSVNSTINALNCVFLLTGTASSTNNCIGYNGVGSPTILGINNTALNINAILPQTTSVQSGITQIQYTNIQPPGLACYSSTADQPIAVTGTPQALTYNTTQFNQGTTLLANSRVYANAQGNYALSYSVELFHVGGGVTQTATTFLKKNGATIANTGRQWSIPSGGYQIAAPAEFVVSLNAGDYVEVFFSGDTSLSANATAAAGALPAVPSVVFNIKQFR